MSAGEWQTAKATYSERSLEAHEAAKERAKEKHAAGLYGKGCGVPTMDDLQTQAKALARDWMTPKALESAGAANRTTTGRPIEMSTHLSTQAAMWPTATASNPNEGETLESWTARRERLKETANNGNGCETPLAIAVKMDQWPTPTSRDHKSTQASPETMERNARPLSEVVGHTAGPPDPESPSTPGKPRGSLNSAWVAQLMGWPDSYTTQMLAALSEYHEQRTSRPSKPSATRGATP